MSLFQPATDAYDRRDQQNFRNAMEARDLNYVKIDRAVDRLYFKDSVTNEIGLLTVVSGVVTWTALP
jgi:hypothetical protein